MTMTDSGRAPSGQALVASDQAASRLAPTGFDPSRMSDPWRAMVDEACADAREQSHGVEWIVNGDRADNLGAQALQLVADTVGVPVIVDGPSDYHEGKTFKPAIAIETRQGGDVQQAPSRSDESAG